jgi:hypothetical protein
MAYLAAAKRPAPGLRMGIGMLIRQGVKAVERAFMVEWDCSGWISVLSSANLLA